MLPKVSSLVHTVFEAHHSCFQCLLLQTVGTYRISSLRKGNLAKNKQSSACTWWLQMFHVHYINYDNKIAHLLNKFSNKNSMLVANARQCVDMPLLLRFQMYAN